jgi:hypothetical protein
MGRFDLGLFVDARNLFDNTNIADVHSRTGMPDDDGNHPRREGYASMDEYLRAVENWRWYSTDPEHYDRPRTITVGATFNF